MIRDNLNRWDAKNTEEKNLKLEKKSQKLKYLV